MASTLDKVAAQMRDLTMLLTSKEVLFSVIMPKFSDSLAAEKTVLQR